jgi:hypothetical protein
MKSRRAGLAAGCRSVRPTGGRGKAGGQGVFVAVAVRAGGRGRRANSGRSAMEYLLMLVIAILMFSSVDEAE